jgi:hypothetical protein
MTVLFKRAVWFPVLVNRQKGDVVNGFVDNRLVEPSSMARRSLLAELSLPAPLPG